MADNIGNIGPLLPKNIGDVNANNNFQKIDTNNENQGGVVRDKVEISKEAKNISKAVNRVKNMPEIRADLVEKAVQERVAENNRVPAYQLAAKMLFEDNIG